MNSPSGNRQAQTESDRIERAEKPAGGTESPVERRDIQGATGKAFSLLETITRSPAPLAISDIVRVTGMTKPTAHRIASVLAESGFIERDHLGGGYIEGPRLVELAFRTLNSAAPRNFRNAILRSISDQVNETCNYGILTGFEVVYLCRVEAKWPLGLRFEAGSHVPAHCTAIGKLLLSQMPGEQLDGMLQAMPLTRYTANTITGTGALRAEIGKIRETGVGVDNQEFIHGVVCVSVPVTAANGEAIGGIAVSAPEARVTVRDALKFVPIMRRAAIQLGATYNLPRD